MIKSLASPIILASLVGLAPAAAKPARADLFQKSATADTYLVDADANGTLDTFGFNVQTVDISGQPFTANRIKGVGVFIFDLAGLTGATVNSATLSLYWNSMFNTTQAVTIYGYADDGTIQLSDGLAGTQIGGTYTHGSILANQLTNINVTALISTLVSQGSTHVGFSLRDTGLNDNLQIVSSENSWNPAWRPRLTINATPPAPAVPEPATLAPATIAGLLTFHLARRRRSTAG